MFATLLVQGMVIPIRPCLIGGNGTEWSQKEYNKYFVWLVLRLGMTIQKFPSFWVNDHSPQPNVAHYIIVDAVALNN